MIKFADEIEFIGKQKEMFDYIDVLRKMHDKDYALKCLKDALLKEYRAMIRTDIWYEAAKAWLNNKVEEHYKSLDRWSIYNSTGLLFFDSSNKGLTYASGGGNWIRLDDLHHREVELEGYEFEKFCIKYKNEKENNSSI